MLSSVLRNCWHIYMWIKSAHCPNTFEMSHWATWQILFDPIPDTYLSSIILKHFICNEIFVCGLFICFPFAHHDANLFVLSKTDEINVNLLNFIKSVLFNAYYGRPLLMLDEFSSTVANIIYAVCSVLNIWLKLSVRVKCAFWARKPISYTDVEPYYLHNIAVSIKNASHIPLHVHH